MLGQFHAYYKRSFLRWRLCLHAGAVMSVIMHHFKGSFAAVSSLCVHINTKWSVFPVHSGCWLLLYLLSCGCFVHIFTGLPGMVAVRPCPSFPLLSSDMLLLWTSAVLTLLCLLPPGQILHQYAGDVHPVPHYELRCFLPDALAHCLWARQGECEHWTKTPKFP